LSPSAPVLREGSRLNHAPGARASPSLAVATSKSEFSRIRFLCTTNCGPSGRENSCCNRAPNGVEPRRVPWTGHHIPNRVVLSDGMWIAKLVAVRVRRDDDGPLNQFSVPQDRPPWAEPASHVPDLDPDLVRNKPSPTVAASGDKAPIALNQVSCLNRGSSVHCHDCHISQTGKPASCCRSRY